MYRFAEKTASCVICDILYHHCYAGFSDVVDDPILFHWLDYTTFALSMLISISVGVYYAFFHKAQTTTKEFLLANRSMSVIPVSISLSLSTFSSISFLGDPVEVYYYGALHWVMAFSYPLALLPVAFYFAPRFHDMEIVSCFEVRIMSRIVSIASHCMDPNFVLMLGQSQKHSANIIKILG